eukprot:6255468-Alexandrium_andersonii.AAC.1
MACKTACAEGGGHCKAVWLCDCVAVRLQGCDRARPLGQQHSDNSVLSSFKPLYAFFSRFKRFPAPPSRGGLLPPRTPPKSASGTLRRRRFLGGSGGQ